MIICMCSGVTENELQKKLKFKSLHECISELHIGEGCQSCLEYTYKTYDKFRNDILLGDVNLDSNDRMFDLARNE